MKVYQSIALLIEAIENCEKNKNENWKRKHKDRLQALVYRCMPSGSGFDRDVGIDVDSTPDRLIFHAPFHHMNEAGYYDGWSDHTVIVTASLAHEINVRVTGRNRNDIKNYIYECFFHALTSETPEIAL